ncbi:MAG TPA: reductive dehalogenase domain-containing protein [Vicinamibacterales bacterium]|nr:reductive dehalogenase domain-containing protein [Vicinamibacterales bacterium]
MSHRPSPFAWEDWYASVGGRPSRPDDINEILRQIFEEQYPRFNGPVAPEQRVFSSPEEAAEHLKAKSVELGADIVGICEIVPSDVYQGRTCEHTHAIAVGQRMRWREFQVVPSPESAIECLRVYYTLGETVIQLAAYIRSLGYACTIEHPIGDSNLLHIPIGLKAGFGELGRHGSIIHPKIGPLFRMGSVALSMPLAVDHPIDAGIAKFCDICRACRKYCPPGAIPDERSPEAGADHLGYDRYVVDTGRCFPYFSKHHYCSICLPVCVYNHKEWARDFEGFETKLFPTVLMPEAPPPVDPSPAQSVHWYPRLKR